MAPLQYLGGKGDPVANAAARHPVTGVVPAAGGTSTVPPDGSIATIVGWVGGDKARARLALQAEVSGKGRKTLVKTLEAVIG